MIGKLIRWIARKIVMKELKRAEDIFYGEFSCEDCPDDCPIGSWDLCEIIQLAGQLKDLREKGIVVK